MIGLEPACWSWDIPPLRSAEEEIARVLAEQEGKPPHLAYTRADVMFMLGGEADNSAVRFGEFHAGRCALCGESQRHLVLDHCHRTGQVRGNLCRSCNTLEGRSTGPLVELYRRRHPAAILGYYEPYTGRDWLDGWYLGEVRLRDVEARGPRPATPWPSWSDE